MQSVEGLSHNKCPLSGNLLKLSLTILSRIEILDKILQKNEMNFLANLAHCPWKQLHSPHVCSLNNPPVFTINPPEEGTHDRWGMTFPLAYHSSHTLAINPQFPQQSCWLCLSRGSSTQGELSPF